MIEYPVAILILCFIFVSFWRYRSNRLQSNTPAPVKVLRWHDDTGKQDCVFDAAAVAEQRKSGRWLGQNIIVDWKPGVDTEIDIHGTWLEQHGAASGVYVRRVGSGQPLVKRGRLM